MARDFDPYHIWLGIPPAEQPPDHYRLLGLARGEENVDVIDAAANRQTAYLHDMANGPHRRESQKLMNEVAAARRVLMDSERRARYVAKLERDTPSGSAPKSEPAIPTFVDSTPDVSPATESSAGPAWARDKSVWIYAGGGTVGLLLMVALFAFAWPSEDPPKKPANGPKEGVANQTDPTKQDPDDDPREIEPTPEKVAANEPDDDPETTDDGMGPNVAKSDPMGEGGTGGKTDPEPPKSPPPAKLVARWTFDAAKSAVVNGVKGQKGAAKLEGGPAFEPGPSGSAIVLDGIDDALVIPPVAVPLPRGTLAFWVRPTFDSGAEPILNPTGFPLAIRRDDESQLEVVYRKQGGNEKVAGGVLAGGKWSHVAVAWVDEGPLRVFLDGQQLGEIASVGKLPGPKLVRFGVQKARGAGTTYVDAPHHVTIADVRFYDGILDAARLNEDVIGKATVPAPVKPLDRQPPLPPPRFAKEAEGGVLVETWDKLKGKKAPDLRAAIDQDRPTISEKIASPDQLSRGLNGKETAQRLSGCFVAPQSGVYQFHVQAQGSAALRVGSDASPRNLTYVRQDAKLRFEKNGVYRYELLHVDGKGRNPGSVKVGWTLPNGSREEAIPKKRLFYPVHERGFVPLAVDDATSSRSDTKLLVEDRIVRVQKPAEVNSGESFSIVYDPRMPRITALFFLAETHDSLPGNGPGTGAAGRFGIGEMRFEVVGKEGRERRSVAFAEPIASSGVAPHAVDGDAATTWSVPRPDGRIWLYLVPKQPVVLADDDRLWLTIEQDEPVGRFLLRGTANPQGRKLDEERIEALLRRDAR